MIKIILSPPITPLDCIFPGPGWQLKPGGIYQLIVSIERKKEKKREEKEGKTQELEA